MSQEKKLASILTKTTLKLHEMGLNHGATGNCSCRDGNTFLITPQENITEVQIQFLIQFSYHKRRWQRVLKTH